MLRTLIVSAFLARTALAQNAACGTANTNTNCAVGAYPASGSTVYYAPSDTMNVEIEIQAEGSCDAGSYADIGFYQGGYPGTFLTDCGCVLLDGSIQTITCQGVPRNSLPEGSYNFQIYLGPIEAVDQFTITHSQVTSTAATPTTTVTSTTFESTTVTTTSTSTNTATSAQITVTLPAATVDTTVTNTPSPATTVTTQTQTKTCTKDVIEVCQRTTTYTAPCTTAKLSTCRNVKPTKGPSHPHQRRQAPDDIQGDGPLTTTVTPAGVAVTTTVDGGTQTTTNTAYTTVTTTVAATPPITTVYSGDAISLVTITLPQSTSTVTSHVTTRTTTTKTEEIIWWHTVKTTPTCKPTSKSTNKKNKNSH